MRKIFTFLFLLGTSLKGFSQSVYPDSKFVVNGDSVFLTSSKWDSTMNFELKGPNKSWDFSQLVGYSQTKINFRDPKNTGYTAVQWPFINNPSNVNTSYTTNQIQTLQNVTLSNRNDYFIRNTTAIAQRASGFTLSANGSSINVKNQFTAADTLYKFPIKYLDTFASNATFATTIPFVYYNMETLKRTNKVDAWGQLKTPYGTFKSCLRIVSEVVQYDTFAVTGYNVPAVNTHYRELRWLDTSTKFPVLIVTQTANPNGTFTTSMVQYFDNKRASFPPRANFIYRPFSPSTLDTVKFTNGSQNSTSYLWNFGDNTPTSTASNPTHLYSASGTYTVTLIAYNGTLSDTIKQTITITGKPQAVFSYSPFLPNVGDSVKFNNLSVRATSYKWDFGDSTATSSSPTPVHVYTKSGVFTVSLVATNAIGKDTFSLVVNISPAPLPVTLVSFKASKSEGFNQLTWAVTAAYNAKSFGIQKSFDGVAFQTFATIPATDLKSYTFMDREVSQKTVYYRLVLTDINNKASLSIIESIVGSTVAPNNLSISPNPVQSGKSFIATLQSDKNCLAEITVYDLNGKLIKTIRANVKTGVNRMSISSLQEGNYMAVCSFGEGPSSSFKFVVR